MRGLVDRPIERSETDSSLSGNWRLRWRQVRGSAVQKLNGALRWVLVDPAITPTDLDEVLADLLAVASTLPDEA